MKRRLAVTVLCLLAPMLGSPRDAGAQTPETRVVKLVVGAGVGTAPDVRARQIAEKMREIIGRPVIVDNRPGAGGTIALHAVARAEPDGSTLAFTPFAPVTVVPVLNEALPYDTRRDLTPVTQLYYTPLILAAHPALGVSSVADLVRIARGRPGAIMYGSPGAGTPTHLSMEILKQLASIDLVHVPYKGGPPLTAALLSGEVSVAFDAASQLAGLVQAGRLKGLAVSGSQRYPTLREIPTFQELGYDAIPTSWAGILAPARTPPQVVAELHRAFATVLASPEIRAAFEAAGVTTLARGPADFAQAIDAETQQWRQLLRTIGIKLD